MKHKGIWITAIIILVLLAAFGLYTYNSFRHKGIDRPLVGQVEEDRYPDWDNWNDSTMVSNLEYDIVSKSGLCISEIFFIQRANHYQVRLRIAAGMPFSHPNLMGETDWILEDLAGNRYTSDMVVYAEEIGGLNCVNITLVLDGEEFENLSGKELRFTAVCSEEGNNGTSMEDSYAHCEMKIWFP